MKKQIFIQANNKQLLGAKIAKYALESAGGAKQAGIPVTIINVDQNETYLSFIGIEYKRGNEIRIHDPKDLQFFTLSRFMPPELMGYQGRALVIDPDIFALQNITEIFETNLGNSSIAACAKKDFFDTSVMLLECSKLTHWNIDSILNGLKNGIEDYRSWMQLKNEQVYPLSRVWNSLDEIIPETKLLHTTNRITQPWKTGLKIDFTLGTVPKFLKVIPRFWVQQPKYYLPHPDKKIEEKFLNIMKEALEHKAITVLEVEEAIRAGDVRQDIFIVLEKI